ncbi:hypothetical protein BH11MYX1_BH11MYX1_00290 [soil metagenome]
MEQAAEEAVEQTSDPRLWKKSGWTARVIRNDNEEGWAVEMTRDGDAEPVLVSPWTMGRNKVDPKPMGHSDFASLVKGANDVLKRHQATLHAKLHRSITCQSDGGQRLRADLDIQLDEDDPHAILKVVDEASGEVVRSGRASAAFKLGESTVQKFLRTGDA